MDYSYTDCEIHYPLRKIVRTVNWVNNPPNIIVASRRLFENTPCFSLLGYNSVVWEVLHNGIDYNLLALGIGIGNKLGCAFPDGLCIVYLLEGMLARQAGSNDSDLQEPAQIFIIKSH
jgi:hypothetical protein